MAAPAPQTIVFAVRGPIEEHDLPGLCERICALLRGSGGAEVHCDVSGLVPDAATIDTLARLQLAAKRHGSQLHLRDPPPELLELLIFTGLREVLPECATPRGVPGDRRAGTCAPSRERR